MKRLFSLYTAITGVIIVTLLVVSNALLRTYTHPAFSHPPMAMVMQNAKANGASTSQSTATRPYTVGEHYFLGSELDQFYHYTNLNVVTKRNASNKETNINITQYRHTVSLLNRNIPSAGLFLRVVERHEDRATSGGSCLYGVSESANFTSVCSSRDFYNGTYMLYCPPAPTNTANSRCRKITVQLQCVNLTAYFSCSKSLHKIIWTRRLCDNDTNNGTLQVLRDWPLIRALKRDALTKNVVTWHIGQNGTWNARLQDGKWFRSLNKSTLCACVKSFGDVYMYGSSHMRFKFDYLMDVCYKRPAGLLFKHQDVNVGNLHYSWYQYSNDFGRILSNRKATFKKKDLVFLQTGAHDTTSLGLVVSMSTRIRQFVDLLAAFAEVSQRKGFKLVVLTSPPSRDSDDGVNTLGGHNNFALAAFNEVIRVKAANMGVEVFDEFSIILPRQDENICGTHYICYNKHIKKITGSVGVTAVQMMMTNVCNLM